MCRFFSLVSDGAGKVYYFDANLREQCRQGKLNYEPDSHTSIADYHGFVGEKEDKLNKYEYNPLTKKFKIDQLNTTDDSNVVKAFCNALDFKTIVPELVIKPIINPFHDIQTIEVTPADIELLEKWVNVKASVKHRVWDRVWDSVRISVWASIGDRVWDSVWTSVWASIGDSVWASVRASVSASIEDSVRDSVMTSVRASIEDSVRDSIGAYIGSFFILENWKYIKHEPGKYPFQPAVDLWERGLVPIFDGKVWRLHGYEGKVLYEGASYNNAVVG